MLTDDLPFLDLTAPGFSTKGAQVLAAREAHWCARTPYGLAVLRHRQAGLLLRDRRLRQGSHAWPQTVGIHGSFADFWTRSVISEEGDRHRLLRRLAQEALAEPWVLSQKPAFSDIAAGLIASLDRGTPVNIVDAVTEPFAGQAIALILGEPSDEATAIARDAATLGLAMGPEAGRHETAVNAATDRLMSRARALLDHAAPDSFAMRLKTAADDAGFDDTQALLDLVVISIFGGVDTTRAQLAFALYLFAQHPDQWAWLRWNPDRVPQALDEVIRTFPTTTWATREALEAFNFDGIEIEAGQTLHIFVHATGTDPLTGDFSGFDIRARRKSHFGFGGGAHHCLGQFVARTDMAAALEGLLNAWRSLTLVGTPGFLPDSGNTSPRELILALDWG